ncbi:hypothetical protein V5O48_012861 [Marasmius crinis-equi]|uniref:NACHT domain-containing protein n=1 Tax=Marasmius crinis-equi TaxID=585013 RepID=A0ABR3F1N8_9AGAR
MPSNTVATDLSAPRGRGPNSSVSAGTKQGKKENVYSGPTRIVSIKPQRADVLGDNPREFILVVESSCGETLREAKWDPSQGGWPLGIVLIGGSFRADNMTIKLQRKERLGVYRTTIASGQSTVMEAAIQVSHNQLEISLVIQSQNVLNVNGRRLPLIVGIDTPSLLPVWITSIRLAESLDGITDKTLESLNLIIKSGQGETIRESSWNSSHELWDVGVPLLRGTVSETLSIELRRKRRTGLLYKTLTSVMLDLEELEKARKGSKKEITTVFVLPRENKLNLEKLVLSIQIGALDIPPTDIRRFSLPPAVGQILENISVVTGVVDKLSELHPAAELAWLVASVPLKVLQDKHELDDKLVDLIDTMSQVYGCATVKDDPLRNYRKFQLLFDSMIQESVECFLFIHDYISKGHLRHMINAPRKVKEFTQTFQRLKGQFADAQQYTTTVTGLETRDMVSNVDNKFDLHELKADLKGELENNYGFQLPPDVSRCLHGTRQQTLSKTLGWIESEREGSVLCLSGIAGSGKTSVMATLHDHLTAKGCSTPLAAYVRFHRVDFSRPSKFVAALVYRLVSFDKPLGAEIAKIVEARSDIFQKPLEEQFESLVVGPLRDYHEAVMRGQGRIVIMVDGLDECMEVPGGSDRFLNLLRLLSNPKTLAPLPFLRVIVASRPEEPIHRAFTDPTKDHVDHYCLDISSEESTSDILHYFRVRLEEIFQVNPDFKSLCEERDALNGLAAHSNGLFIRAIIIFRFLKRFPSKRLEQALQLPLSDVPPRNESTYQRWMRSIARKSAMNQ